MEQTTTDRRRARMWRRAQPAEHSAAAAPRGARRLRWLWGVVPLVGLFLWVSSIRVPAGPAAGRDFNGVANVQASRDTIRVGLWNIHGGRGLDRRRDLARTADTLRDLDLAGLNEVLGPKRWWQTDQCHQLGELLGVRWLFAPTESRWWDGSFGNGMLARVPIDSWQRIPLPLDGAHTYRNVVLTSVTLDGREFNVLLTHLDSRDVARRREQTRVVGALFLSLAEPAILMGDFNAAADDPELARLMHEPGVVDAVAAGMPEAPATRIDWIFSRGLTTVAAGCTDNGASDHALWWAELRIAE